MDAKQAKEISRLYEMSGEWILNSIKALIYHEAVNGKLHCDWCSNRLFSITDYAISFINENVIKDLIDKGYHCKMEILEPNKDFANKRIRIHISWE